MFFSRGKNRIQNALNISDMYKQYISDKQKGTTYYLPSKMFTQVCDMFYSEAVEQVLKGKVFKLPFGLGEIEITKRKIKVYKSNERSVDWKTTLEIGKKVYHLNEHTNGYNYGIDWRNITQCRNFRSYRFIGTRYFKRTLAKLVKNKEQDYYERD